MNDYSDILFLVGAVAIYSVLTINTNRAMLTNSRTLTTTEMEYGAVSVAQNIIEKARWMKYDDITETNKQHLVNLNTNPNYNVAVEVDQITLNGSDKSNREITIKVTSNYMGNRSNNSSSVTMRYIKTDRN
jgi:hypothetical protein